MLTGWLTASYVSQNGAPAANCVTASSIVWWMAAVVSDGAGVSAGGVSVSVALIMSKLTF